VFEKKKLRRSSQNWIFSKGSCNNPLFWWVPGKRKLFGEKEKGMKCLLWISKKFIQTRNFFRRCGCLFTTYNWLINKNI